MAATLKLGSVGADVETWQGLLASAGYAVPSSGVFDEATRAQTVAWQKAKGLVPDGIVGPASWGAMTGKAIAAKADPRDKEGREVLLAVWPAVLEEALQSKYPEVRALGAQGMPNLSELQIAGAMAKLESGYGHSSYTNKKTGEKSGVIWNWGAVQAGKPPCDPATSFQVTDTGPSGEYNFCYKKYPTSEAGALDFLRLLTVKRPTSWALMKTGDLDAYSVQMHSWTPPLTQLGVGTGSSVLNKDPVTGVNGYFEQPPLTNNGRAATLAKHVMSIAGTMVEPISAVRGGPFTGESPSGTSADESGASTAKKLVIAGGLAAAVYAAIKIWLGWPR